MLLRFKSHTAAALAALLLLVCVAPSAAAQKKSKTRKPTPRGTPVLWRDTNPGSLDLAAGPGGNGLRPVTRGLRFIKEEKGG